jgi:phosphatidylglycerophosphatase A
MSAILTPMQTEPNSSPPSSLPPSPFRLSPSVFLATGFGAGLVFPAPGTIGAAQGSLVALAISYLPGLGWQLAAIAALIAAGIPICTAAGHALGGKKDNQAIIWDEIASMPLVFLLVPIRTADHTSYHTLLAGFALHRLFDITKPPPARQLEHLPEGLGVMADDCAAALYAAGTLYLIAKYALPLAS